MAKKILFLIPYFGRFPEWFPFYLESCRWNPTIDWIVFTDCEIPKNHPENFQFIPMSFEDYQQLISDRLGIDFKTKHAYTLCNMKPALGYLHQEYLTGYDYFGYTDIDVIYGDLRAFLTDDVLTYNTISTHPNRASGHLFLIKNEEPWVNAFRQIPNWKQVLSSPVISGVAEGHFTKVLLGRQRLPNALRKVWAIFDPYKRNNLFEERYSTSFSEYPWKDGSFNYPNEWYWDRGKLTTSFGDEMMYLHFMNWKSSKYLRRRSGNETTWESLPRLIDPELTDPSQGFCISARGFTPLRKSAVGPETVPVNA